MKNIKKLTLVTLLSTGVIFTTACSQGSNTNTDSQSTTQTEQKEVNSLTKENASKVILDKLENLASIQVETNKESEIFFVNSPFPVGSIEISNISHFFIKEGNQHKIEDKQKIKQGDKLSKESINIQLMKDGNMYLKHFARDGWMKYTNFKSTPTDTELENIKTYLKYNKDFEIKDEAEFYVLTLKPSNLNEWTEFLKQNGLSNLVSVENFEATFKIDKKSFLPSQVEITNKGKEIINDISSGTPTPKEKPYSIKAKSEFKNFNSVAPIEIPEEAKNAQEITKKS